MGGDFTWNSSDLSRRSLLPVVALTLLVDAWDVVLYALQVLLCLLTDLFCIACLTHCHVHEPTTMHSAVCTTMMSTRGVTVVVHDLARCLVIVPKAP